MVTYSGKSSSNAYSGIKIAGGARDITITGNRIGCIMSTPATQRYGIDIDSGDREWIIANNSLFGNLTAPYNNNSSGSQHVYANNIS